MTFNQKKRLVLLVLVLLALVGIGKLWGVESYLTKEGVRQTIEKAGIGGYFIFFVLITVGQLLQIPSGLFMIAAVLAYGKSVGGILGVSGAIFSANFSFVFVRMIGGKALEDVEWKYLQKVLKALRKHPIRTTFMVRFLFTTAPILNYALALSPLSFKNHFIGSLLGLIVPLTLFVLFFDWVLQFFS